MTGLERTNELLEQILDELQNQQKQKAATRPHQSTKLDKCLMDRWNEIMLPIGGVPTMRAFSQTRSATNAARVKEHGLEKIYEVFSKIPESDFLCGRTEGARGPFYATYDWAMNPSNFLKILEGNYDNKKGTAVRRNEYL